MNDSSHASRIARQLLSSLQLSGVQTLPTSPGIHSFSSDESGDPSGVVDSDSEYEQSQPTAAGSTGPGSGLSGKVPDTATENMTVQQLPESSPVSALNSGNDSRAWESDPLDIDGRISRLRLLEEEVSGCTRCSELAACRNRTVFGVGNPAPELCFLGEGPGADEDRQGEPFVGAAGQLLNRIIAACGMTREEVYILNTVKCRPPRNRNPEESELENCWPYALEQLELLQPRFICCLGSVAARTLLQNSQSIGKMRGRFYNFRGSRVVVTYHPAYLLRNPAAKRQVWDDMKMLLAAMGRSV